MRQEMMGFWDGSGISWTICKQSAPRSRHITTPAPHHSIFTGWMLFLMSPNHTVSKHWRQRCSNMNCRQLHRACCHLRCSRCDHVSSRFSRRPQWDDVCRCRIWQGQAACTDNSRVPWQGHRGRYYCLLTHHLPLSWNKLPVFVCLPPLLKSTSCICASATHRQIRACDRYVFNLSVRLSVCGCVWRHWKIGTVAHSPLARLRNNLLLLNGAKLLLLLRTFI